MSTVEEGTPDRELDISTTEIKTRLARLTPREHQIMEFIVAGMTSKEMADRLHISVRTVEVHRAHIMLKMGTKRVPELVRWFLALGQ